MNMFARFDENPAMTLQVFKETKHYGRTDKVKIVYPPQTKFAGGYNSGPDSLVVKASALGVGGLRFDIQCRQQWGSS